MAEELINADFDKAHRKAFLHSLASAIRRTPNDLVSYADVQRIGPAFSETYRGMKTVPVSEIVGSVDRYRDFDRSFLPRQRHTAGRWKQIDRAYHRDITLPPIQLYKVGDVYFVKDGNHRVSVARQHGVEFIDAEVIERRVRAPLRSSMSTTQILQQLEYAEFLRQTDLDRLRPDHDIRPTGLGRFDVLLDQIRHIQQRLSRQAGEQATLPAAAEHWFDHEYLPVVHAAQSMEMRERFPLHTDTDIYLWALRNRERIGEEVGESSANRFAEAFMESEGKRDKVKRFVTRLLK